jgi:hypothetical protein
MYSIDYIILYRSVLPGIFSRMNIPADEIFSEYFNGLRNKERNKVPVLNKALRHEHVVGKLSFGSTHS